MPQQLVDSHQFSKNVNLLNEEGRYNNIIQIPSGGSKLITLGMAIDAYDVLTPMVDSLTVTLEVKFDDGTMHQVHAEFAVNQTEAIIRMHFDELINTFWPLQSN